MKKLYQKYPLAIILLSAFVLRTAAAFYNYTPTAEDDYANIIEPALKHYQTGSAITIETYRLPVLPKTFYLFIAPLKLFAVTDTKFIVSWGLAVLGLISLAGVWGFYKLSENFLPGRYKELGGWLYAAHFILPFYSTRAFQESLTLTTMPGALYLITKYLKKASQQPENKTDKIFSESNAAIFWGAFLIGLTVIFRFQVAILALPFLVFLLIFYFRKTINKSAIFSYILGGVVSLALLVGLDLLEARPPFSTPLEYFRINYEGNIVSESYGSAPWYTYITLLAVVFIPPVSFILLFPFFKALRENLFISVSLILFVLIHSLIGNKLERFMLPVLPLFFLLTLQGMYLLRENRLVRYAGVSFIVLNFLLLIPVTFSRSQLNIINAAGYLTHSQHPLVLYKIDLWKQGYMTYGKPYPPSFSEAQNLHTYLNSLKSETIQILALGYLSETEKSEINNNGYDCIKETEFHPSWQENLVIKFNPKFNARRNTSVLYLCKRK